jgi:hypothetical protein
MNDADPGELSHWVGIFLDKIRTLPSVTDVTTDQLNAGPLLDITIKREVASSYGILPYTIDNTLDDAFGQRIVSTMYTTLQISRRSRGKSKVPVFARRTQQYLRQIVERPAGPSVDAGRFGRESCAAGCQSSGSISVSDEFLQPRTGRDNRSGRQRHPGDRKGAASTAVAAGQLPG